MDQNQKLPKSLLYLMAFGAGLIVANNYYNQPLLGLIAKSFQVSESEVSNIPLFTQVGYAFGLLFLIPLGDKFNRKKLMLVDFLLIIVSLIIAATSSSLIILIIASFMIGFSSVIPQFFVPMAAQLANPNERGKAIGIVMSGLLIGILGSRFISGFVGEYFGWRAMYYIAAVAVSLYGILIYFKLPAITSEFKGTYKELMKSIWFYFKSDSTLRLASLRGAIGFAGFSAFWTTLVFLLEDVFNYGSGVAGAFGALGICGALAANVMGKLSDRMNKNKVILIAIIIMIFAWLVFYFSTASIIGLVIGVILLDMGLQSLHITNQSIILSGSPEAGNRINTIYMVIYFIGGALGTITGAQIWEMFHWKGVAVLGMTYTVFILFFHVLYKKPINTQS
ncbi:MFS transporter [Joostella atrarenae]|uniref:MFS transporter n=1 Tax=Joostella atrarenae TaxID=679257 RepID=A0ABS9J1E6_9FLAO|nr:MFS transporter [Joostella atrarenae]MCF8714237.1 MFS transporter [Joostella atrarenae]